jgi:hypothetical protein
VKKNDYISQKLFPTKKTDARIPCRKPNVLGESGELEAADMLFRELAKDALG